MKGRFLNPNGFCLDPVRWQKFCGIPVKHIYLFRLKHELSKRLTYIDAESTAFQPDLSFETDMGSVPRLAQLFIQKDRFKGFYLHDSGYAHRGLWVKREHWPDFKFQELPRSFLDSMLHDMILSDPEPGWPATADAVWAAVRSGGWCSYGKGDLKKAA